MCSIVGIRDRAGGPVTERAKTMMEATRRRGPDRAGLATLDERYAGDTIQDLPADAVEGPWALGHLRLAITGDRGLQPMADCRGRFLVAINGEVWNHRRLRDHLVSHHDLHQDADSVVVPHLIEEHLDELLTDGGTVAGHLPQAVARAVEELDGEYALAVATPEVAVLARDPLGIKPLYHGRDGTTTAFASERKALWALGLEAERVPPNSLVVLGRDEPATLPRPRYAPAEPERFSDRQQARAAYARVLEEAVWKRIRGVDRVAVIFSGGVDSCLVAQAAQRLGAEVRCFVAGAPDSPDVEAAREAAEDLGLDLHVSEVTAIRVEDHLPDLLAAVEERNQLHLETALPLYFASQDASDQGYRVLLTGQGADELFAGYPWYPRVLEAEGPDGLRARMRQDRNLLYKETLEREDKVTMYHSVELRVPFLDPNVVQVSERLPVQMLVEGPQDPMGKRLHRELAQAWGLPEPLAWREKEAAQHGSQTRDLLLDAVEAFQEAPVPRTYDPAKSVPEPMGSSQRYGHAYVDADPQRWRLDARLQWVLDRLSLEVSAVSPNERERLQHYLGAAEARPEPQVQPP